MVTGILGKKIDQYQSFLEDGMRVPVTRIMVEPNLITQVKQTDKEGYNAVQLGIGSRKKATRPLLGHSKKAGVQYAYAPRFLREIRADEAAEFTAGGHIKAQDVLKPGDIIDVTGISKGKGFAGVVKRHHFKGGPRTHGQSDRERAPGSIGQTTTPGRVYRGKRMAGRMGNKRRTVKNLVVLDVADSGDVLIKGLVPGIKNAEVIVKKTGENKKFVPLFKKMTEKEEVKTKEKTDGGQNGK